MITAKPGTKPSEFPKLMRHKATGSISLFVTSTERVVLTQGDGLVATVGTLGKHSGIGYENYDENVTISNV